MNDLSWSEQAGDGGDRLTGSGLSTSLGWLMWAVMANAHFNVPLDDSIGRFRPFTCLRVQAVSTMGK